MSTYVVNMCAKFHLNFTTKYGDIISRRAKYRCYGQRTDYGRLAHVMLLAAYCWRHRHENENDGANKW